MNKNIELDVNLLIGKYDEKMAALNRELMMATALNDQLKIEIEKYKEKFGELKEEDK